MPKGLFDSVPYVPPNGYGPQSVGRKPSLWDNLDQVSYGVGDGLVNQLASIQQMVQHPVNTARGLFDMGRNALMDPAGTGSAVAGFVGNQFNTATGSPYGFGKVLGENIGLRPVPKNALMHEMTAYHGSPHDFEKFSMDKIGTGEGAQAYGHGLYFAESRDVAKAYTPRDTGMEERVMKHYSAAEKAGDYDAASVFEDALLHKSPYEIKQLRDEMLKSGDMNPSQHGAAMQALKKYEAEYAKKKTGFMYDVDIPDEHIDKMLDWDKPLSQQPESVRKALRSADLVDEKGNLHPGADLGDQSGGKWGNLSGGGGGDLYQSLVKQWDSGYGPDDLLSIEAKSGQEAASKYLHKLGLPGIKYLDQGSRDAEKGTRNFVLFDDKLAKVIKKE